MDQYTSEVSGHYSAARDQTSFAILSEVAAGRGSPHGGVWLDFRTIDPAALANAFGPVIDILKRQNIDLTSDMVEVAPTAHFFLSGIEVDAGMRTKVEGLFACGEVIYGMHGANRLSGNAITEALVTGRIAGETAAVISPASVSLPVGAMRDEWSSLLQFWHPRKVDRDETSVGTLKRRLQAIMQAGGGPLRTESGLAAALDELSLLRSEMDDLALAPQRSFALGFQEKIELRGMITVSEAILRGALARRETRGAQVRLDYPETDSRPISRSFRLHGGRWRIHESVAAIS
jgi:succinate dehydrogenase / fumarate reductase flavoprotein subunit/fumarate reductase (CoM/CoB) subunit A